MHLIKSRFLLGDIDGRRLRFLNFLTATVFTKFPSIGKLTRDELVLCDFLVN